METSFGDRILPIDAQVADRWAILAYSRRRMDGLLAATALVHDLAARTRNVRDVKPTGVRLLDPFTAGDRPHLGRTARRAFIEMRRKPLTCCHGRMWLGSPA